MLQLKVKLILSVLKENIQVKIIKIKTHSSLIVSSVEIIIQILIVCISAFQ